MTESASVIEYDARCCQCWVGDDHTTTEHATSVAAYIESARDSHQAAAGAQCHEGPDGMCLICETEMTTCAVCGGVGYHREGCSQITG